MADTLISTAAELSLPPKIVNRIFTKVAGHSAIVKLSANTPIPFTGSKQFVFTMDDEVAIVGEGGAKPAGDAKFTGKTIVPIKVVYQHRVTDEFVFASEEDKINYLEAFADGFAKKIARGIDIMVFHGVNPATGSDASFKSTNSFDGIYASDLIEIDPDDFAATLDSTIGTLVDNDKNVTGLAFSASAGAAMAAVKENGVTQYPEFRFGGRPESFAGYDLDINNTVTFGGSKDMAIVGDFKNAFKWGYAKDMTLEVIEYGNPDGGTYDLKQSNEVCLRSEAYIGWGILDEDAFAVIAEDDDEGG